MKHFLSEAFLVNVYHGSHCNALYCFKIFISAVVRLVNEDLCRGRIEDGFYYGSAAAAYSALVR